jgi:hypothetical protein
MRLQGRTVGYERLVVHGVEAAAFFEAEEEATAEEAIGELGRSETDVGTAGGGSARVEDAIGETTEEVMDVAAGLDEEEEEGAAEEGVEGVKEVEEEDREMALEEVVDVD